jgi:hypothetical protein
MKNNNKIHILFNFIEGPTGGGNQFLKCLKEKLILRNVYSENIEESSIVIVNGHHSLLQAIRIKKKFNDKIIIHRLDGFVKYSRLEGNWLDKRVTSFALKIADGVILQSNWVKEELKKSISLPSNFSIILNAANPVFSNNNQKLKNSFKKIRLVSTSWSKNSNKGFLTYNFLDNYLDFNFFDFTIIGNCPIKFKNIKIIPPLESSLLAKELFNYDVFLFASKNDACSNSLIEAVEAGLTPFALDSGGNSEIIGNSNFLFNTNDDLLKLLKDYQQSPHRFQYKKNVSNIDEVADKYITYCRLVYEGPIQSLSNYKYFQYIFFFYFYLFIEKFKRKLYHILNKFF